jgi:hypothetical protein
MVIVACRPGRSRRQRSVRLGRYVQIKVRRNGQSRRCKIALNLSRMSQLRNRPVRRAKSAVDIRRFRGRGGIVAPRVDPAAVSAASRTSFFGLCRAAHLGLRRYQRVARWRGGQCRKVAHARSPTSSRARSRGTTPSRASARRSISRRSGWRSSIWRGASCTSTNAYARFSAASAPTSSPAPSRSSRFPTICHAAWN